MSTHPNRALRQFRETVGILCEPQTVVAANRLLTPAMTRDSASRSVGVKHPEFDQARQVMRRLATVSGCGEPASGYASTLAAPRLTTARVVKPLARPT